MKYVVLIVGLAFGGYTLYESYLIASVGVANHISQLIGDGGANFAFAVLCLVSSLIVMFYPRTAAVVFVLTAMIGVGVGALYQDPIAMFSAIVPLILAGASLLVYFRAKAKNVTTSASVSA